jgi:hypothetical protein
MRSANYYRTRSLVRGVFWIGSLFVAYCLILVVSAGVMAVFA